MVRPGFVPKPVPVIVKSVVVPACQVSGLIEEMDGVGSPAEAVININLKEQTESVLKTLTPREEQVIKMRFGLGDGSEHTLEEVGRDFSVTRERIRQIAESRGMDANEILQNIIICRVLNSSHLELIIKTLGKHIEKFKAKLLIVDSIISLHRADSRSKWGPRPTARASTS
jgi:hypothetical protein